MGAVAGGWLARREVERHRRVAFLLLVDAAFIAAGAAVAAWQGIGTDDGRYYVQGKHAHAWPEIYFEGVGWVPFEPTPGRGNAGASQYTGVAPDQADD